MGIIGNALGRWLPQTLMHKQSSQYWRNEDLYPDCCYLESQSLRMIKLLWSPYGEKHVDLVGHHSYLKSHPIMAFTGKVILHLTPVWLELLSGHWCTLVQDTLPVYLFFFLLPRSRSSDEIQVFVQKQRCGNGAQNKTQRLNSLCRFKQEN